MTFLRWRRPDACLCQRDLCDVRTFREILEITANEHPGTGI